MMKETIRKILLKILPLNMIEFIRDNIDEFYRKKSCGYVANMIKQIGMIRSCDGKERYGFILLPPYDGKKERILGQEQYFSQIYQDMYLDNVIFNQKQGGVFLDIGGNEPIRINNTYFFETKRNWTGLAFEPMPDKNALWKECRKVECLSCALGEKEQEVEFCQYDEDYMSGIDEVVDFSGKINAKYKVKMRKLSNVLLEKGIDYVDFMSLDTEGYELKILEGIDFDRVTIHCIVIENEHADSQIHKFLFKNNYRLTAKLWWDEVWIKEEI